MSKRKQSFAGAKTPLTNDAKMQFLLQDVCVKLGFCGADQKAGLEDFKAMAPVDKETFADFVLKCEGLEPWAHPAHRKSLEEYFAKVFEAEFVSDSGDAGG